MQPASPDAAEDAALAGLLPVDLALVRAVVACGAAAEIVDEQQQRRQQHREEMVRFRRRKKSALERMRSEEKELTKRLRNVLRLRASGADLRLVALADMLSSKERLHQVNLVLRRQWEQMQSFEAVLRSVCASSISSHSNKVVESLRGSDGRRADGVDGGRWVTFLEDEPPFYYVPFTEHECRSNVSDNARHVFGLQTRDFEDDAEPVSRGERVSRSSGSSRPIREPVVVHFFNWRAQIVLEWDEALQLTMIRYKFCKTFRHPMRTLDEVVERMWEVHHSPTLFQSLYRVPVHLLILQRWNDDMSIALWSTPRPDRSLKGRATSLFSRSSYVNPQGDACKLLMITGVELKQLGQETSGGVKLNNSFVDEQVVYTTQGCIYNVIKRSEENNSISIEHGGCVEVVNKAMAEYLMVEIGCSLVRIENLVLPMRVLRSDT